jgi:hypothetical protein
MIDGKQEEPQRHKDAKQHEVDTATSCTSCFLVIFVSPWFKSLAKLKLLHCKGLVLALLFFIDPFDVTAQANNGTGTRKIHYTPDGRDFVTNNGPRRFNRALYGGNTAFRAEAGDLPEFALYLPGMGGNLKFGLIKGDSSKWLINAASIEARYRPGSMLYTIRDGLLDKGSIHIAAIALFETEGLVVKVTANDIPGDVQLIAAFGGATGTRFSREGDIGADPESSFYLKPEYCKDNIYRVNKNTFSLFFGSRKPLTEEERYEIQHLPVGRNDSASTVPMKTLTGVFPEDVQLKLADASMQSSPLVFASSSPSATPAIFTKINLSKEKTTYFLLLNGKNNAGTYKDIPSMFERAEANRAQLAGRITVNTPDKFINTLGGALSIAADAIWEDPTYLHGAVAWRMRLNGWRGAYAGDVLGWHDRARRHFDSYALSQLTTPSSAPVVMDTALHLARGLEKLGTSLFSSGYICRNPNGDFRAHHYDMNLVFVDQLLNHFCWTGDTAYVRRMWPLLVRHLDWEKRNFDRDGDGLYDAYAAIWASDALQYSGGGVTHSSAYNYRSNKMAADLAKLIGENPKPYEQEADKILRAMNSELWMASKGWYAEYKDLLGKKLLHPAAALWTIYHSIDSRVPDPFQTYQLLRYVDTEIPHIPIGGVQLMDRLYSTLSTSNWQPYTWSLNNVVLAEVLHTALAYWQGGRSEKAYILWKAALFESMYQGASPGNIQQLSYYDAIRGELYRDFADDVGMAARSLAEGLFGIFPDALHDTLHLNPGFPSDWDHASIHTPDIDFSFARKDDIDQYKISKRLPGSNNILLRVRTTWDDVEEVTVNGKKSAWSFEESAIGLPLVTIRLSGSDSFHIRIKWQGSRVRRLDVKKTYFKGEKLSINTGRATIMKVYDPQHVLKRVSTTANQLTGTVTGEDGYKTFFIKCKQRSSIYWMPVEFKFSILYRPDSANTTRINRRGLNYQKIDLKPYFNEEVNNIFKNQYLSPRPARSTLQLPTQGIGNWAYPLVNPLISDSGLRKKAESKNEIVINQGMPFAIDPQLQKNIVFVSQWDNFPDSVIIPLKGRSSHAYLLMAGSTNPMQSRMVNGEVEITYKDGSASRLKLKNPENWWPIEQDYFINGLAFTTDAPRPPRISLKTGEEIGENYDYTTIRGFSNRAIDGGAATVLDLHLDPAKELKSIIVKAIANDVIIGLMSLTLVRP